MIWLPGWNVTTNPGPRERVSPKCIRVFSAVLQIPWRRTAETRAHPRRPAVWRTGRTVDRARTRIWPRTTVRRTWNSWGPRAGGSDWARRSASCRTRRIWFRPRAGHWLFSFCSRCWTNTDRCACSIDWSPSGSDRNLRRPLPVPIPAACPVRCTNSRCPFQWASYNCGPVNITRHL